MTKPTPKAVLIFSFSLPISILIVSVWRDIWYASFYYPAAVVSLMLVDLLSSLSGKNLRVTVKFPASLYVGRTGDAEISLSAGHGHPVAIDGLLEQTGEADPPRTVTCILKDAALCRFAITPRRRGQIRVNALWLRWRGPLGLVETIYRREVGEHIDVLPDIKGLHEEAIRFFASDASYGVKSQRMKGEGTEFEDLCDYEPGMDYRLIDWKHSARHRKILCKEFRQERNHHIVAGFDTGRLMLEPVDGISKLDRAIRAGLLLGWVSLRGGDFLGGCGFDVRFRNFIKPGRGMTYFTRFQKFTAELAYRTEETNFTLGLAELNSRLSHRSLVVLFTEFADTVQAELMIESIGWIVRKHAVIFVSMRDRTSSSIQNAPPKDFTDVARAVIADDFLKERQIVLERVSRMGVHCLDVPAETISAALLNRYIAIKRRGLL
ncbi:MAG: DUF58 domain-containing protein [Synergistaceae bacterium]|jgi:uncharacterized protein (DUF58 family)|nr:DUF58 domain-containing protein [Synergistaceae bacterium]